ncbi:hypothetical protein [Nocardia sp. NBC_00416]|uniref:hypothetical protein n=1 Tax=Nocardia sp. NBC_00416 TaxID=2975991 RepID=UPI002E1E7B14
MRSPGIATRQPRLLACLTDHQARPWAARHPALPPSALTELLHDDDRQVVEAAAANPSLPDAAVRAALAAATGGTA